MRIIVKEDISAYERGGIIVRNIVICKGSYDIDRMWINAGLSKVLWLVISGTNIGLSEHYWKKLCEKNVVVIEP